MSARLRLGVFGLLIATAVSAQAEPKLQWRVKNNFALFASDATQTRFASDFKGYLVCMQREYNPLACASSTEKGLTRTPYAVRFNRKQLSYKSTLVWPTANEPTKDRVTIAAEIADAPDGARCTWTVDDERLIDGPCDIENLRVRLHDEETPGGWRTPYKLVVKMAAGGTEKTFQTEIRVKRVIVVSMGDSFMSGEGNPHIVGGPNPDGTYVPDVWLEKRCHRSLLSAGAQTAWRLAEDGKSYVVYINAACSGATTWHVPKTDLGYTGVETAQAARDEDASAHNTWTYLPPQIQEVRKALCGTADTCAVRPDHIILSIGINDLNFSEVVTRLVTSNSGAPPTNMTDAAERAVTRLGRDASKPGSLLHVYKAIETELKPRSAVVMEYPDPTKDDRGAFCNASPIFSGMAALMVDAAENKWAEETLMKPLNAAIGVAVDKMRATASHWQMAMGIVGATEAHGYCADKSHSNLGQDAKVSSGTLHPNAVGHAAVAAVLHKLITARPAP